ncbi:MAG: hypothetical protein KIS81_11395 [Maricaulaceae bacterium]|nr:hypothetical protein [Maricaulaceae bacterium]
MYKSLEINRKIKGASFRIDDVLLLISKLENQLKNKHCSEKEKLLSQNFENEEQKQNLISAFDQAHVILTSFICANGEHIMYSDSNQVDASKIPKRIKSIIISSITAYKTNLRAEPQYGFNIKFDFNLSKVLDWESFVSAPTTNDSFLFVRGDTEWVGGVEKAVRDLEEDGKTKTAWIHQPFVYDLFLFILAFPISFLAIYRINSHLLIEYGIEYNLFTISFYIYLFLVLIWVYRILFFYIRRSYPLFHLKDKNGGTVLNKFISPAIGVMIVSDFINAVRLLLAG